MYFFNQGDFPPPFNTVGCGLACALMVLNRRGSTVRPDEILAHAETRNVYVPGVGCKHAGIARMFLDRGILAYNQEFTHPETPDMFTEKGLQKIAQTLRQNGAVIASIGRNNDPNQSGHLVVVREITDKIVVIDDPDYELDGMSGLGIQTPIDTFTRSWRKLAIFIEPN